MDRDMISFLTALLTVNFSRPLGRVQCQCNTLLSLFARPKEHECTLKSCLRVGRTGKGEQHGSRINTCFRFPRFYNSSTMLPTPGGGGNTLLLRFKSPTNVRLVKNHRPLTVSLVRTTTTRWHDLTGPHVPRFSV